MFDDDAPLARDQIAQIAALLCGHLAANATDGVVPTASAVPLSMRIIQTRPAQIE